MKKYIFFVLLCAVSFFSCDSPKNDSVNLAPKPKVMKENVIFNTSDNIKIHGTYYYSNYDVSKKEPLVVLIHQFMSDRGQWKQEFIDTLVARKYKVLTYDIRNHGESDKAVENSDDILTAKGNAILDVDAVFNWAKSRIGIDSTRIAVVGTSVGASLGLYAKYFLGAKTVVCLSVGRKTFEEFIAGKDLSMKANLRKINSVFFICGDNDGRYPDDAKYIYENFTDEPKELKFFGSDKHGKDLCLQYPEIRTLIVEWLAKHL